MNLSQILSKREVYRVHARMELRVREVSPVSDSGNACPFEVSEFEDGFLISWNPQIPLLIQKNGEIVFNGFDCKVLGSHKAQLVSKAHEVLKVRDFLAREWEIGYSSEDVSLPLLSPSSIKEFRGPVAQSILLHAGSVGLLLIIFSLAPHLLEKMGALDSSSSESVLIGNKIALKRADPFSGLNLKEFESSFRARVAAEKKEQQPAVKLARTSTALKSLFKSLSFPMGNSEGVNSRNHDTSKSAAASDSVEVTNRALSQAAIQLQRMNTGSGSRKADGNSAAGVASRLSQENQKELRLRVKIETLKPKFTAAFDRALRIDPQISITLSYSGVVGTEGRLNRVSIKSVGKASPTAIGELESLVKKALESESFGKELAGTTIRGEQIFIR